MEILSPRTHLGPVRSKALQALVPRESRPDRVGPRITAMRETLALSKAQLADSVSLDRSSLTKIEKGDAGLDIAVAVVIAARYGFGLNFIYRGDLGDVPPDLRPRLLTNMVTYKAL